MRYFLGFTIICLVTVFVQALTDQDSFNAKSPRSLNVVNTRLATCDLSDVGSNFEQLITGAVYSLADVVISLEGSMYETVTCAQSGIKGFWSCAHEVWTEEIASIKETVETSCTTAQDLIADIVQDLLTCIHL